MERGSRLQQHRQKRSKTLSVLVLAVVMALLLFSFLSFGGEDRLHHEIFLSLPGSNAKFSASALPYNECLASIVKNSSDLCLKEDWEFWNNKAETRKLVEEYGGTTPAMDAFVKIYNSNYWGCSSGPGSTADASARTICLLQGLLASPSSLGVTLLVDFPCGDQQWAPLLRARLPPDFKYIGVDVVPGLIQRNREKFGNERTEFLLGEMGTPDVFLLLRNKSRVWDPQDRVAIVTRHALQHNDLSTNLQYLRSVKSSGATYFLGSYHTVKSNTLNIGTGGFGHLNLHLPPFNFPRGILEWFDAGLTDPNPIGSMSAWLVDTLPNFSA